MVEYLSEAWKKTTTGLLFLSLFFSVTVYCAEILPDPTRPPSYLDTQKGANSIKGAADIAVAPVLQLVLISPERRIAVINGQHVAVGDKFGEAKVIKITQNQVVLRAGKNVQTLTLFDVVKKKLQSSRASTQEGSQKP